MIALDLPSKTKNKAVLKNVRHTDVHELLVFQVMEYE